MARLLPLLLCSDELNTNLLPVFRDMCPINRPIKRERDWDRTRRERSRLREGIETIVLDGLPPGRGSKPIKLPTTCQIQWLYGFHIEIDMRCWPRPDLRKKEVLNRSSLGPAAAAYHAETAVQTHSEFQECCALNRLETSSNRKCGGMSECSSTFHYIFDIQPSHFIDPALKECYAAA